MKKFLQRFGAKVTVCLWGFDRPRFRGNGPEICYPERVVAFLFWERVLLRDFGRSVEATTERPHTAIERAADECGLPTLNVASSAESKEDRTLAQARERGLTAEMIPVLRCVESCRGLATTALSRVDESMLKDRAGKRQRSPR